MGRQIIGLQDWLQTPLGQYVADWEQMQCDRLVVDIFGYNALQLGLPQIAALQANRMPNRWTAGSGDAPPSSAVVVQLLTDFSALPFDSASLDLVVLPHTLELAADPHATLREVERVLVPEGRVVICGFNPLGFWGLRQWRVRWFAGWSRRVEPQASALIGYWRLRDWLRLLGLELESTQFGCNRLPVGSQIWLNRLAWMEKPGARWWPILGSLYCVVAVKRVRGMRLLGPAWKSATKTVGASMPVANQMGHTPSVSSKTSAGAHGNGVWR